MKTALPGVLIISIGMAALAAQISSNQNPASDRIDRTSTREIDLTRDGKPEKIVLHVTGKEIHSPFTWTIGIYSNGRRIFYQSRTEPENFDEVFSDSSIFGDCGSPESCKLQWYFNDIMRLFFYALKPIHLGLMNGEQAGFTTFNEIRNLILKTGKASSVQADRIVGDLRRDIENGKAICIIPDVNPYHTGPMFLWIPIIDDFIFIYVD